MPVEASFLTQEEARQRELGSNGINLKYSKPYKPDFYEDYLIKDPSQTEPEQEAQHQPNLTIERRANKRLLPITTENIIFPKVLRTIAGVPQPGDETIFDILDPEDISYIKNAVYGGKGKFKDKFTASSLLKDIFKAPARKEHAKQERQEVAA